MHVLQVNAREFLTKIFCLLILFSGHSELHAESATSQALATNYLRVCADPSNLPFSNDKEEGFENKIIDLVADELNLPVKYTWWPQTIGFVRNTLRIRLCDLIAGISTTSELVQNTNPYYRSVYTMIYRADSGFTATRISDPQLLGKRIGVVAGTPPATLLALHGLSAQAKGYQLVVDTRSFTVGELITNELEKGDIDVALVWGPIGSYYAAKSDVEFKVIPLLEENPQIRLDFRISMATRYNEVEWKRKVNRILRKLQPKIDEILVSYHVPLLDELGRPIANGAKTD